MNPIHSNDRAGWVDLQLTWVDSFFTKGFFFFFFQFLKPCVKVFHGFTSCLFFISLFFKVPFYSQTPMNCFLMKSKLEDFSLQNLIQYKFNNLYIIKIFFFEYFFINCRAIRIERKIKAIIKFHFIYHYYFFSMRKRRRRRNIQD